MDDTWSYTFFMSLLAPLVQIVLGLFLRIQGTPKDRNGVFGWRTPRSIKS